MKMLSLQSLMLILCIALSFVTRTAQLIIALGYEGHAVDISCSYPAGYESYEKYLCRDNCDDNDVLIKTTGPKKNKYSITDDKQKRVFTTTISGLTSNDAGKYWCGVTKTGKDLFSEVKLEVGKDSCCDQSTQHQSYEESSVSFSCPYEPKDQKNLKYICRGRQTSTCLQQALITSNNNQQGRFNLTDNKRSNEFTVSIASLILKDAGSYLCGVQRNNNLDVFTAVDLEVKEWCCVRSSQLSGTVGRPVTLQCLHPPQHRDNRKFICKGDQRATCTDMMSDSRFSLQENVTSSFFLVRVREIKAEDTGTYWCGSDPQWKVANYTKIQLSVDFPHLTAIVVNPDGSKPASPTDRNVTAHFLSVGVAVPTVCVFLLLALTFSSVMICRYKCRKVKAEVSGKRNQTKKAEADEVISVADDYENSDVIVRSKQRTSRPLSPQHQNEDDSVYQNFSTDEIYCNQMYAASKR
ncbi:polymeric immunoglobulin receptor-like isoform X2 [Notolabrus celidotus]|uniref:polymeric immunoglobulin receptor-like isoform X2 n=1 Tax=Notolabrus celidotus TaxID=1203425 RepID=UPI00149073DD|nr:polymeric immunoglobulin receptor-like isoform X2 [Notolabrus celidotus]